MRCMSRIALLLVLFVVAAVLSIGLTFGQSRSDVTITGYENAPGCTGPMSDGAIKVSNSSSVYWYKVQVVARVENDSDGNARCDNDPPDCSGQSCQADLSNDSIIVYDNDDKVIWETEYLPSCKPCTNHCDNETCSPTADHCTCVIGTYLVTHYSNDDGENWVPFSPAFPSVITDKERNPLCPDPGPGCD